MARILCDGNTKVTFVPTIVSIAAPTVAELTAGKDLQDLITPDGVNLGQTEDTIDGSVLSSTQNYQAPGRNLVTLDLTFFRDGTSAADVAWTTLVRGTVGFLVIRRDEAAATAYVAADKVEVYSVTVGQRQNQKPAKNTYVSAMVHLYASGDSSDSAVVAA